MTSSSSFSVDTSQLKGLARKLRRASPEAAKAFRTGLDKAGKTVAASAKVNAGYSKRIPGSIKKKRSGETVSVVAGGDAAPDAAPIENSGKGFVRHPVFGDRKNWTSKNSHPAFLHPALDENRDTVTKQVTDAVRDGLRTAGLSVEE